MRILGGRAATLMMVVAWSVAGCSDGGAPADGRSTPASPRADTSETTPVEEALGLLAGDVGYVDFSSDRRSAERLGLFDDTATTYAALGAGFEDRAAEVDDSDLAAIGPLAKAVGMMTDGGAGFSQLDVRWSMRAFAGEGFLDDDGRSVEVVRLVDGVDMDDVVADLTDAGFEQDDEAGWVTLRLDGQLSDHIEVTDGGEIAGRYPRDFFPAVSVHPDTRLVATGDVTVLDPSGSSAVLDTLARVLPADLDGLERFLLTPAAFVRCWAPVDRTTSNRATPEKIADWAEEFGTEDLGVPGATTLWWTPGEDVVHRSYFADPAAAQQALAARQRIYRTAGSSEEPLGVALPAEGNESPYEPGWTLSRQEQVIEVLHNRTNPAGAIETYLQRGLGFDACGAPGMFS